MRVEHGDISPLCEAITMLRKLARFRLSGELLRVALALPDDTLIYNIERDPTTPDIFIMTLEHPQFEPIIECAQPPERSLVIHANYDKRPDRWLTVEFVGD